MRGGSNGLLLWKPSLEEARAGHCFVGTETVSPKVTNAGDVIPPDQHLIVGVKVGAVSKKLSCSSKNLRAGSEVNKGCRKELQSILALKSPERLKNDESELSSVRPHGTSLGDRTGCTASPVKLHTERFVSQHTTVEIVWRAWIPPQAGVCLSDAALRGLSGETTSPDFINNSALSW